LILHENVKHDVKFDVLHDDHVINVYVNDFDELPDVINDDYVQLLFIIPFIIQYFVLSFWSNELTSFDYSRHFII